MMEKEGASVYSEVDYPSGDERELYLFFCMIWEECFMIHGKNDFGKVFIKPVLLFLKKYALTGEFSE